VNGAQGMNKQKWIAKMAIHRAIVVGIAVVAAIAIGAITLASMDGSPGKPTAGTTPSATPAAVAGPSTAPSTGSSTAPPSSAAPSPGATTPRGTTTEQHQPGAVAGAVFPSPAPIAPLYTGPLPKPASAIGKLVAGFPSVIPLAQGSTIADSSVSSSDGILQATLVAKTSLSASAVIALYQSELAKVSLQGAALPAIGGSTAFGFARDGNSITLTVTPSSSGGSTYSVLGVLHPAS
jgi:hypothetical protein